MDEDTLSCLTLTSVEGLGCRGIHRLTAALGSPRAVVQASPDTLNRLGLSRDVARSLSSKQVRLQAEREFDKCRQRQVAVLTLRDPRYPSLLKEIFDPPIVLFASGDLSCLALPSISMVGSRKATAYGLNTAEKIACDLAERGLLVTSGLARGVDTASHRGALRGKGQTVAVLGSGLDFIYPRENRVLARQIRANGCILSEFPLASPPLPRNFPMRNRIISGISWATCLVEANQSSGSLITTRLALDQGREVLAVPGNITSKTSCGPNLWIKQGAKLVQDWRDIVEELPLFIQERLQVPTGPAVSEGLTEKERGVLESLSADQAIPIDQLLESTRLTSSELLCTLSELELKDRVRQLPGKAFLKRL
jgi:DNA processing protein